MYQLRQRIGLAGGTLGLNPHTSVFASDRWIYATFVNAAMALGLVTLTKVMGEKE